MGKIIAVVNQKGGVGKTTSAVNLTAALTALGLKVLLCDFDPQANATSGLGLEKRKIKHSVYDVTINDVPAEKAIVQTKFGDVLPSSADLAGAAVELLSVPEPNKQLKKALEQSFSEESTPSVIRYPKGTPDPLIAENFPLTQEIERKDYENGEKDGMIGERK